MGAENDENLDVAAQENAAAEELEIDYDSDAVSEPDESDFPKRPPQKRTGFDTCVIVDGIPTVTKEKEAKLKKLLTKLYGQVGTVVSMHMPFEGEKSLGF